MLRYLIVFILTALSLSAQSTTATLVGTVRDSSGGVIPGAALAVRNSNTNQVKNLTTGPEGEFTVPDLEPGSYEVSVEHPGYGGSSKPDCRFRWISPSG
jgi:hypothetical protein